ncbi:MAG: PH domain-containing protein [Woeseia sp.]
MADVTAWQRTSPLAALFYLGKVYQAIARNAFQSLAPLAAFVVAYKGDPLQSLLVGGGLFVAVTFVLAFLNYWFFRYRILEHSILIRQGVLKKKQLDIKFDRVQALSTEQNVVYRFFNLLTVTFDTAGSSGQEGYLPAVRPEVSTALAACIRRTSAAAGAEVGRTQKPEPLVRLDIGDMVRIGLSSGRVFLLLLLLGPLGEYVSEKYGERLEETAVIETLGAIQIGFAAGIAFAAVVAFVVVLVLAGVSITAALLRYHRFELFADDEVLRSTGGLLTRHENSVHRTKVQSLHVTQNVMLRFFGRFRLGARQASSGKASAGYSFVVPLCRREELTKLSDEFFPREFAGLALDPRSPSFMHISPWYLRSRILLAGVLPAAGSLLLLWRTEGAVALLALLWIPLAALGVLQVYRRYGFMCRKDGMAFRSGFTGFRVVAWLHRKVQRVTVTQSPFQRRKHLATVRLHLAAGPAVKIPFLEYDTAAALRDYVLWRVESSQRAWH